LIYNTVNMFIHTGGMLYRCRDGIFLLSPYFDGYV